MSSSSRQHHSSSSYASTSSLYVPTTPVRSSHAAIQPTPHFSSTRRHSLYGAEDRIVIDPGSRIWKAGFSGEGKPRAVFYAGGSSKEPLWTLKRSADAIEHEEEDRNLFIAIRNHLRRVFHDCLLTDPRARKVIIIEHPLLPNCVKEMMAAALFDNLQVPSLSFACSHLSALISTGRITGLVVDCGYLESTALPIFAGRPMFSNIRTSPLAGARLNDHIRALLLLFGTYIPPPTSLSAAVNVPTANRSTRVPREILTESLIEDIKTRCCFVGDPLSTEDDTHADDPMSGDEPGGQSESNFSRTTGFDSVTTGFESNISSQHLASTISSSPTPDLSSDFSVISLPGGADSRPPPADYLEALAALYTRHSTASELRIPVTPPVAQQHGTGLGHLVLPGWIRERAAEMLFEGGDVDERSLPELILDALLAAPVDLRRTLASQVLISGGSAMLPGFLPRLHAEILRGLRLPPSPSRPSRPRRFVHEREKLPIPAYDPYSPLRPLAPYIAILNNPSPPQRARQQTGKAPAFTPAAMAWIGGSLAGALKIGGAEIMRERWDEASQWEEQAAAEEEDDDGVMTTDVPRSLLLPDWTRPPLPVGAPHAPRAHPPESVEPPPESNVQSPPQPTPIGA
ncbi:actin-like ATPase domain-containing protein [Fistulina hepatica ATCC 64428]|uniref:Actin-like ATPase domain-containing protein n=1 Tax=Fistulina hepatica ATCC 64428 TaxID=1128425 RepID=A0A0D7AJ65_9AGAR|nr:actin-like ATPase domain-containing protein [Fistulina hepatica ATCC 64428]